MARKQQLIHLHSTEPLTVERASGATMAVGEIAVQAAADKENSSLWILTSDKSSVVRFPSVEKVNSLITDATSTEISGLKESVSDLQTTLTGYNKTDTVQKAINGVKNDLQGEINTIKDKIGTGFTSASTITSQLAAVKTTADTAKSTADTNTNSINGIKDALGSLTSKNAVPNAINAAKTTITTSDTGFIRIASSTDTGDGHINYSITANDIASDSALTALSTTVGTHATQIAALQGLHADGKTVAAEVADGIAKVVANAPSDFDTLKEIADWIKNDTTGAASMANDIKTLKDALTGYSTSGAVQNAFTTVNGKISTINSVLKGLSGESAVSNAINAAKTTITEGTFNGVKVEKVNTDITDGHTNYKISGVGLATSENLNTLSGTVATLQTSLNTEITDRTNGDNEIKGLIGGSFNSTNTVAKAITAAKTKVARSTDTATTKFLAVSDNSADSPTDGVTYTLTLTDVASANALSTLDTKTVQSGTIKLSDTKTVTGQFNNHALSFDLSTMVIDCGEY